MAQQYCVNVLNIFVQITILLGYILLKITVIIETLYFVYVIFLTSYLKKTTFRRFRLRVERENQKRKNRRFARTSNESRRRVKRTTRELELACFYGSLLARRRLRSATRGIVWDWRLLRFNCRIARILAPCMHFYYCVYNSLSPFRK